MRLFVGIEVNAVIAAASERLIQRLQSRAVALAPRSRIAWIPASRLHITVRFIGETADPLVQAVIAAFETPIPVPPFDLSIAGVGAFPPRGTPRVVWAGLDEGLETLIRIERAVTQRLSALGITPETRPFSPHLTLARVRDAADLATAPLLAEVLDTRLGRTRVDAITLFESRLAPNGPDYIPVRRTLLGS